MLHIGYSGPAEPTHAKRGDAGYDLISTEYRKIRPFERAIIKTSLRVEIPYGYYGRIAPRSGLAAKNGIDVLAGVIDSGYRGEVGVILINLNCADFFLHCLTNPSNALGSLTGIPGEFEVKPGDSVAQLIIEKYYDAHWVEKEVLSSTERGEGGFGHTTKA